MWGHVMAYIEVMQAVSAAGIEVDTETPQAPADIVFRGVLLG